MEVQYLFGETIPSLVIVDTKTVFLCHLFCFPTSLSSLKKESQILPNFWEGIMYPLHVARNWCFEAQVKDLAVVSYIAR